MKNCSLLHFRYPESVRWGARNGASIVFHPHFNSTNAQGIPLTEWGHKNNPYYEKAAILRAMENTIYFASCNYASYILNQPAALLPLWEIALCTLHMAKQV
ncbi:MAG: hypothetical protein J7539_09565 [Niabella sp.]|nr:hypothetical protein [Niabella sp.]